MAVYIDDVRVWAGSAGFIASSPELARIGEWNRHALERSGISRPVPGAEAETP